MKVYGDLLQGNFQDSYQNLTYKHTMAFKWFVYNCPNVNYLLKTDDDVFVNTPLLYETLEIVSNQSFPRKPGRLMICTEVTNAKVKRSYRSKWHVSFETYNEKFYPNYCSGFSIIYSADVVFQLYNQTQNLPYFWIDDVHITGIVRSQLNISIVQSESLFLSKRKHKRLLNDDDSEENLNFLFAQPDLPQQEIEKLWKIVS
jgi:Galactosyltransferase